MERSIYVLTLFRGEMWGPDVLGVYSTPELAKEAAEELAEDPLSGVDPAIWSESTWEYLADPPHERHWWRRYVSRPAEDEDEGGSFDIEMYIVDDAPELAHG